MPAVTTEIHFTIQDVLRFMIQTGRFRDLDGNISESRVEAAQAFLATDWEKMQIERFKSIGFDPERPNLDEDEPEWREDPKISSDLATYLSMKEGMLEQLEVIKSGPNDEYTRAENALLMCQRVDLWCAGPKEVERAVQHLYKLGRKFNDDREVVMPPFIAEFSPAGQDVMEG